jgi:hypothetical protein
MREYTDTKGRAASGPILVGKSVIDKYSRSKGVKGKVIGQEDVVSIVKAQIAKGALPKSTQDIYNVYTSPDVVTNDGFCSSYCGYHSYYVDRSTGKKIVYSFVGNASKQCPKMCSALPFNVSPNGFFGIDSAISILGHEIVEAISDPYLNGYVLNGAENADICAWRFGTRVRKLASKNPRINGAYYNLEMNGKKYLMQENLSIKQKKCLMGVPKPTAATTTQKTTTAAKVSTTTKA